MAARRRTKIVATLGPATKDHAVLDAMISAGMDVVRLNFSHGSSQSHIDMADRVRNRASDFGREVGVLVDLQGPKIRISRFKNGGVKLVEGEAFTLDAALADNDGDSTQVGVDYKSLPHDVKRGDTLLLDDGRIVLWVESVIDQQIHCRVTVGGMLTDNKGINRQGGGLSASALTAKDMADIKTAAEMQADYLAVSFPRSAEDIHLARRLLREAGGYGGIIAKIERAEALDDIDAIIEASEGIMVARGDLGVEMGDAALPPIQKQLIAKARRMNRLTITATQMMESMIESPIPTRAEVFDVANAVLDGTDAVMLSGETAVGHYPVKVIEAMDRICLQAEQQREIRVSRHRMDSKFARIDEAIATMTESGATPLWMSRISSGIPIFALTPHVATRRRVTLYRGVYPVSFVVEHTDHAALNKEAIEELQRRGVVKEGDIVIITKGDLEVQGSTSAMKIVKVGTLVEPRPSGSSCE